MITQRGIAALLGGAAMLWTCPALADVRAGVDAWTRGDFTAAIREWQAPADRGDADAQFNLAQAYKLGRGVRQDLVKAEQLFGKAAAQGHLQASDNFGLLLFQRGQRAQAMPYISAAAGRGDPRAQYLLGVSHFNGDNVPKDWVRAYALVSLAQQAGLEQARPALTQMDQHVPLDQRQQAIALASDLAAEAESTRARQLAAVDLGATVPSSGAQPAASVVRDIHPSGAPVFTTATPAAASTVPASPTRAPSVATAEQAVADAQRVTGQGNPATAPANLPRPVIVTMPRPQIANAPAAAPAARPAPAPAPRPAPPPPAQPREVAPPRAAAIAPATGPWRVQLGAFGVAANADTLWNRVKSRPELAGHSRLNVRSGSMIKLQASGYATQSAAQSACSRLSGAGFTCIVAGN